MGPFKGMGFAGQSGSLFRRDEGFRDHEDPLFGAHSEMVGQLASADGEVPVSKSLSGLPRVVGLTLGLAWQVSPLSVVLLVVVQISIGVTSATGLLAANSALVELLRPPIDEGRFRAAVPGMVIICVAVALSGGMRILQEFLVNRIGPEMGTMAGRMLLRSAVSAELAIVDDPDFHNSMALAKTGSRNVETAFGHVMTIIGSACSLIAVASTLGSLHPVLFALSCVTGIPRGFSAVRAARRHYLSAVRWIENTRKIDLLSAVMTERDSAEEIRVHNIGGYLVESFTSLSGRALWEQRRLAKRTAVDSLLAGSVSGLLTLATYGAMGILVWTGDLSLANVGTALLAIPALSGGVTTFVTAVNVMVENALSISEWHAACCRMEVSESSSEAGPLVQQVQEIRAEGICFRYPGADRDALSDVDVTVRCGEVVALVGVNGSGKSTLARVLAGLYLPSHGSLTWDGRPVAAVERASISSQVSMLAQRFVTWPFTVRANVGIGRPENSWDDQAIDNALRQANAMHLVSSLKSGKDTLLALNFRNGVQLSGGQWQRIGLARAEYRDAPFVILDEPTAALDPESEIEVFSQVAKAASAGKAVLLVTHRLASTRIAHRIHVMSQGRIVESGTHEDLLDAGGVYAGMYRLQARQFDSD
ncbi:ABC transporter ATP-binding protein [Streptomyces sp. NPDC048650]|uniref:ABC transporter ATP-binding protein n=1 Tax=unclassified Streptomyces TaxID=2593676 RepID=UPI003721FDE0